MNKYDAQHPFLQTIVSHPLMLDPEGVDSFRACISHIISDERFERMVSGPDGEVARNDDDFWATDSWEARLRPYNVSDGVLQIPVMGLLLNRFPYQLGRWATGYKYIEEAVLRGLDDSNVNAIALITDSPGGEVAGCFELADFIYDSRGDKPIRAFAADHAYSAAYCLSSSADSISVTRSGGVGSIGVMRLHFSFAGALKKSGVKPSMIIAGRHKKDGNPFENLPKDVSARMQARVDKLYGVFVSTVSRNRGMEENAVRATEALTYDSEEALANGLVDRVGSLEDEISLLINDVQTGDNEMKKSPQGGEAAKTEEGTGETVVDVKAASAQAADEARAEERDRTMAVLDSEEATTRPASAKRLLATDMGSDDIIGLLGDLPKESAVKESDEDESAEGEGSEESASGRNHFQEAMSKNDNPNVGVGDDEGDEGEESASNAILADYESAGGMSSAQKH